MRIPAARIQRVQQMESRPSGAPGMRLVTERRTIHQARSSPGVDRRPHSRQDLPSPDETHRRPSRCTSPRHNNSQLETVRRVRRSRRATPTRSAQSRLCAVKYRSAPTARLLLAAEAGKQVSGAL